MGQFFILRSRVQQEYNSLLVNALNRIFKSNLSLNTFKWLLAKVELSYVRNIIPRSRKRLSKWIPRSKSGASKSRPLWAAHTRIGNVWEYPPGENGPTFLDFPLFLGIFQWDEPMKRVPFTAEPEIPEILTKWKAPIVPRGSSRRSLLFFVPYIFFRPFRLSLAPFICPWVSGDASDHV